MSARVIARDQSLTPSRYCCGEAEISGQLPCGERLVLAFPRHAGRALGAGVAELHARSSRRCCACTKSTMRFQASRCAVVPQARAAGRDARVGRRAGHLGDDQAGAAHARARRGAPGGSRPACRRPREYCAIGETTTRFFSVTPRSVNGVNIGGTGACGATRCRPARCGDPVLVVLEVARVAQAQVLVADALAARQQRVGELLGRQAARSGRRSRTTRSSCAPRSGAAAPRCCARAS